MNLNVTEMKVYVPAKNFALSIEFYRELGFELTEAWAGSFDCRLGPTVFRLQNYFVPDWANNFMMQFQVDDACAWYDHVKPIIGSGKFAPARISAPENVGDSLITHIVDPSGVLLIFIQ
ncbi:MAG: hypothetical protein WBD22_04775 [Pyrinomonadaceae bacterium]